jgi:drug/metabolite transporter (DMT)-like permease
MKWLIPSFRILYGAVAFLFGVAGVGLMVFAVKEIARSFTASQPAGAIEGLALLAVALVALEIAQTVTEEEVIRKAHVSAPTRVRRYLSRFLVVVVVALGVETVVGVMQTMHESPANLPNAASIGFAAAALLAGWGAFIWFNRSAEELEPEAMEEAKREDRKLK